MGPWSPNTISAGSSSPGGREIPVHADTTVTWLPRGQAENDTASELILGAGREDPQTFSFRGYRPKDEPRLLEVATCYSVPRAAGMVQRISAGEGAYWVPGIRLESGGIRYRAGLQEARRLLPYGAVRSLSVGDGRFRIETEDGTAVEVHANRPNFLAGRIVLEELLPETQRTSTASRVPLLHREHQ